MSGFRAFVKDVFAYDIFDWQEKVGDSFPWAKIIIKGRQSGGSWVARKIIARFAATNPNATIVCVSNALWQVMRTMQDRIKTELYESKLNDSIVASTKDMILFSNGSKIFIVPNEPASCRGFAPQTYKDSKGQVQQGAFGIFLEEACWLSNFADIFKALEYPLYSVPPEKRLLLICSSPAGENSPVFPLFMKGQEPNDDYISFTVPSYANPSWKGDKEKLKAERSEVEYLTEVEGRFAKAMDSYFAGVLDSSIGAYEVETPETGWTYYCGFDGSLGISSRGDYIVVVVIGRASKLFKIVELRRWKSADESELEQFVLFLHNKYSFKKIAVETFQAKALHEFCQKNEIDSEMVHATSSYQAEHFSDFHSLMAQRRLMISPHFKTLLDELSSFQQRIALSGNISFGSPQGMHDDCVYAVLHALNLAIRDNNSEAIAEWFLANSSTMPEEDRKTLKDTFSIECSDDDIIARESEYF